MKRYFIMLFVTVLLVGCGSGLRSVSEGEKSMILKIRWQRLVDEEGKTCVRCGSTQKELRQALKNLEASLRPLGMEVALEEKELTPQECAKDITESNRIWIEDRPLEEWLGGKVGTSPCGSCCSELGDTVECRTVSVGGKTYEEIPAQLIVKAGLLAATQIMEVPSPGACCPASSKNEKKNGKCCPESGQCKQKTVKNSI